MKRLVVVLAAALVAVAVYAVTAPAGPEAVSPRRVAALEKKVTALQKSIRSLNSFANCLNKTVVAMASYGTPNTGTGYVYVPGQGQAPVVTTAVDLVGQGEPVQFFLPAVERGCVSSGRLGHVPRIVDK
jgi:hypothetical protein